MSFARPQPCEYRTPSALGRRLAAFTRRYADETKPHRRQPLGPPRIRSFFGKKAKTAVQKSRQDMTMASAPRTAADTNIDDYRTPAYSDTDKSIYLSRRWQTAARDTCTESARTKRRCSAHICRYNAAAHRRQLYIIGKNHIKNLYKNQPWRPDTSDHCPPASYLITL